MTKNLTDLIAGALIDLEELKMNLDDAYEEAQLEEALIKTLKQQLAMAEQAVAGKIELQKRVEYLERQLHTYIRTLK